MNRVEKGAVIEDLQAKFDAAKLAIVTDYRGLTVSVVEALRHELRRNDAELKVAKNTLLARAVKGTAYEGLEEFFTGTTAVTVAYGDPVQPAKIVANFVKDHPAMAIRSGSLDGKLLDAADIIALSKLPAKDILLAQMLSVLNGVPTGLVQVLSAVPRTFLYALQAVREKKEQETN